ncbi:MULTISPECIES: flagellar basal body-associated FliL family protein [Aneurinibacillus]|uniref:Flagellar protein FliL n=1 Tax=Aneurinibacillus thermoaerophilus TaxID=143495 RepID=A0A1G7WEQ7_ANETH|nr:MULTISPECIES: flagellar basal body-associated FliL family protein [Aneurinibacillus]AMA72677.1 hypothetical protein ACH33_07300 [Aneurinibacillus sp. XH2]MED0674606.1 flagellar basal body-associated FliL family protein [Aneurinibacillus thermoaerophilus]MED0677975.1 flagellar basal body-associated FliL family protein [Aneurinibacillus thermoaerophilus]MED0736962.1 flagellar basal body-associated FliL family protein [Aneurinibacillus thermoaerophilus]MED0756803.1 flagellar basal body-associa
MANSRLLSITLIILMSITLIVVVSFILWQTYKKPESAMQIQQVEAKVSAEEFEKATLETEEIRTNLLTGDLILAKFAIQAQNEKTKHELELRKPQVIHIILKTLSSMKPEEIQGPAGMKKVEEAIKKELNQLLEEGKVVNVITTHRIVDV